MKVFVAIWEHKHATDLSVHRREEGAKETLRQWAQGCLEEWNWENDGDNEYTERLQDLDGAVDNWPEISSGEYMEIRGPFEVGK